MKTDSALRKNLDEAIYDQRATDDQNLSVGQQKKKFVLLIKISSLDFCKYLKIKESQSFVFTVCFFPGKTSDKGTSPYGPKKPKVVLLGLLGVIFIITRQLHQAKNSSQLIKE